MKSKFGSVLKAALLAGLLAAGAAALFHSLVTEPLIDQAIQLEGKLRQDRAAAAEPAVTRSTQKAGLILGLLLYGTASGLLLALLYRSLRSWLPPWTEAKRGLALALVLGLSISIFPFLKYPANPPGVGEAETIGYRQTLYLGSIALSVLGAFLALLFQHSLSPRRSAWLVASALYVCFLALVYWFMPPNPDPITMPAEVVWRFRTLSLFGLVLFWGVMAVAFSWLRRKRASTALR